MILYICTGQKVKYIFEIYLPPREHTWLIGSGGHTFTQPWNTHMRIFWCLLDALNKCSFVGMIKPCHLLTGLFWDVVDSFAGLFDGFCYMVTGDSTSKADKFDNLGSMKILNTSLAQKRSGIRTVTKRPEQEQNQQKKKAEVRLAWRMRLLAAAMLERWPHVCRVKITFTFLPTICFDPTSTISMKYLENWVSLENLRSCEKCPTPP